MWNNRASHDSSKLNLVFLAAVLYALNMNSKNLKILTVAMFGISMPFALVHAQSNTEAGSTQYQINIPNITQAELDKGINEFIGNLTSKQMEGYGKRMDEANFQRAHCEEMAKATTDPNMAAMYTEMAAAAGKTAEDIHRMMQLSLGTTADQLKLLPHETEKEILARHAKQQADDTALSELLATIKLPQPLPAITVSNPIISNAPESVTATPRPEVIRPPGSER